MVILKLVCPPTTSLEFETHKTLYMQKKVHGSGIYIPTILTYTYLIMNNCSNTFEQNVLL